MDEQTTTAAPTNTESVSGVQTETTSIDMTLPPTPVDFMSIVPPEYKETEWVKNTAKSENPVLELFKQRENLEKMLGSRPTIPGPDATPEQIAEWNKSIGVPEDPKEYATEALNWEELGAVPADKPVIEFLNSTREGPMADAMKQVAQKAGLRPEQYAMMQKGFELATMAFHRDSLNATIESMKTADQQFTEYMAKTHGQNADAVVKAAADFAQRNMPPELHALLPQLSGTQLGMLATMYYSGMNKFVREDGRAANGFGSNTNTGSITREQISERGRQLMSHPAYFNTSHPEHDALVRQVNENYEQLKLLNSQQR